MAEERTLSDSVYSVFAEEWSDLIVILLQRVDSGQGEPGSSEPGIPIAHWRTRPVGFTFRGGSRNMAREKGAFDGKQGIVPRRVWASPVFREGTEGIFRWT